VPRILISSRGNGQYRLREESFYGISQTTENFLAARQAWAYYLRRSEHVFREQGDAFAIFPLSVQPAFDFRRRSGNQTS